MRFDLVLDCQFELVENRNFLDIDHVISYTPKNAAQVKYVPNGCKPIEIFDSTLFITLQQAAWHYNGSEDK